MAGDLPHWEIVALKVGMGQKDIDDIINNHRSDADRRCAFLRKWIADKGNAATYRALDDVLIKLGELELLKRYTTSLLVQSMMVQNMLVLCLLCTILYLHNLHQIVYIISYFFFC